MDVLKTVLLGCSLSMVCMACEQQPDMRGEEAALLQVDREFSALTATEGYIEAYYRYSADQVLLLPPGTQPRRGREVIYREDSEEGLLGHLQGFPEDGSVSSSGDLGWTWGRWVFTVEDEQGNSQESHGKYLNVWGKIGGQWKLIANIWNDNPPP